MDLSPEIVDALGVLRAALRRPGVGLTLYPMLCEMAALALASFVVPVGQSEEPSQGDPDEALTAAQSARESGWRRGAAPGTRSGFSPRWFYDHADDLPFRVGGRGRHPVRFSKRGLRAWLAAQ